MKSPTVVSLAPTFTLAPLVLMRTCRRSGKVEPVEVLVQKLSTSPLLSDCVGIKAQLLKLDTPVPLLKLTTMKELVVPAWAAPKPLAGAPWV